LLHGYLQIHTTRRYHYINVKANEAQEEIYRKLLVNETMLKARLTAS
jgi:hypothetical protein